MVTCQRLLRPDFWKHVAGVAPDTMITYKNKNGVVKIFFSGRSFKKSFIGIIRICKGIQLLVDPETIFLQCIFWKIAAT